MIDLDHRLSTFVDKLERPVLHILLHVIVAKSPSDQSLRVKDGIGGVLRCLVFRCIADQTFILCEGDP